MSRPCPRSAPTEPRMSQHRRGRRRRRRPGRAVDQLVPHPRRRRPRRPRGAPPPAHEWADSRWDNFTLVTPNWQCRLPGYAYDGPDPDGFMTRDEVVDVARRVRRDVRPARARARTGSPSLVAARRRLRADRRRPRRRARPGTPSTSSWPPAATTCPIVPPWAARARPRDRPAAVGRLPQPRAAPRGRRAGRRLGPVRRPDRRGPAPRRAARCTSPWATPRGSPAPTAAATA